MSRCSDSAVGCQAETDPALAPLLSPDSAGPPRLALTGREAAAACGLSERSWRRADDAGLVPLAVRLGRRKLWPVSIIRLWLLAGGPRRDSPAWLAAVERLVKKVVT